jgi:hypothetical protein
MQPVEEEHPDGGLPDLRSAFLLRSCHVKLKRRQLVIRVQRAPGLSEARGLIRVKLKV